MLHIRRLPGWHRAGSGSARTGSSSTSGDQNMKEKRIVVTRAPHQTAELDNLLCRHGARPLLYPCIAIVPPENVTLLDAAVQAAAYDNFDWLVVTSANAVLVLAQRLKKLRMAPAKLANVAVAAVGPATAEAVQHLLGLKVT